jgi:hypothetical protein
MTDQQKMAAYNRLAERFIALANEMKDAGHPIEMVSAAMMSASGTYATYVAAGNDGYLKPGGVDKVVAAYRQNLLSVQAFKEKLAHRK